MMSLTGMIFLIRAQHWPAPAGKRSKSPLPQALPAFIMLYSAFRSAPEFINSPSLGLMRIGRLQ